MSFMSGPALTCGVTGGIYNPHLMHNPDTLIMMNPLQALRNPSPEPWKVGMWSAALVPLLLAVGAASLPRNLGAVPAVLCMLSVVIVCNSS